MNLALELLIDLYIVHVVVWLYVWHPLIYACMYLFVVGWMDGFMCVYVGVCQYMYVYQ